MLCARVYETTAASNSVRSNKNFHQVTRPTNLFDHHHHPHPTILYVTHIICRSGQFLCVRVYETTAVSNTVRSNKNFHQVFSTNNLFDHHHQHQSHHQYYYIYNDRNDHHQYFRLESKCSNLILVWPQILNY